MKNMQLFSRVGYLEKLSFTKHLSVMIKSGIIISEAVETLIPETKNSQFQSVLKHIFSDIQNGQPLSKALSRYPSHFDPLYISLVRVGEESGTLDDNLVYLAQKMTKEYTLRKKIQGILMYPMIVIAASTIIGGYISLFVLPQLLNFFSSLNAQLPFSTKILLWFAALMKNHGPLIFAGLIALLVAIRYAISTPKIKPYWHRLLLRIPVYGTFLRNVQMASLCRNVGVMLKSGLSITGALDIEYDATDNLVFKSYIHRIRQAVTQGKSIGSVLSVRGFRHVPPIAAKMITVGEKTGKLDESFLYLGDFFEEEVDSTAKNFSTVLEPILFIVIGLIVAFLAFAIITPIYQLTGSIRR